MKLGLVIYEGLDPHPNPFIFGYKNRKTLGKRFFLFI